eukprot:m.1212393 g.1212393  ORF g.1212393 m.1212393 type:complete len:249 (+) comp24598_c0_seq2:406-1152(+)
MRPSPICCLWNPCGAAYDHGAAVEETDNAPYYMAMPKHMSVVYDAPMSDGDGASPLYMQQTLDPTVLPTYCNPIKLSTAIAHQRTSAVYDAPVAMDESVPASESSGRIPDDAQRPSDNVADATLTTANDTAKYQTIGSQSTATAETDTHTGVEAAFATKRRPPHLRPLFNPPPGSSLAHEGTMRSSADSGASQLANGTQESPAYCVTTADDGSPAYYSYQFRSSNVSYASPEYVSAPLRHALSIFHQV